MAPPSGIHAAAPPQGPGPGSTDGQQGASLQQGDGLEPGLMSCGIPAEHLGGGARAEPGPLSSFGDLPPPQAPLLHLSPLMSPRSAKGPYWGLRSPPLTPARSWSGFGALQASVSPPETWA